MSERSDFSRGGFMRVAEFRSDSNPSKFYIVSVRPLTDGTSQLSCDCPRWKFGRREGSKATGCKHINRLMSGDFSPSDCKLTRSGEAWLKARKALAARRG